MKQAHIKTIAIALGCAPAITMIIAAGALQRMDKWLQDALYQRPGATSTEICIIGIDETALTALGPYNSWDRNVMASALEALAADASNLPAVVAVDTLYLGESDPEADARLARAAAALGNVITATAAEFDVNFPTLEDGIDAHVLPRRYEEPCEALRAVTTQGHINAMYDLDGVMRHALLYIDVPAEDGGARRVYSMAYEAARAYLGQIKEPPANRRGHDRRAVRGHPRLQHHVRAAGPGDGGADPEPIPGHDQRLHRKARRHAGQVHRRRRHGLLGRAAAGRRARPARRTHGDGHRSRRGRPF